jgi:hypothetical protein
MYTPDEIREIFDEYQRHRALNIPISKELADRVRDASVGIRDYSLELERNLDDLKASGVGLFKAYNDGKQGASVYNDVLTSGAEVLAGFLKKLGPAGTVLGFLVNSIVKYVTAVNEQSDALFDSYTELNKFGAGLDTGVDGIFQVSQQLGYGTKQLEKFSGLIEKNRLIFPMFGGTTSRGVKEYSGLVDSLRGFETEFRVLGMSSEDVNESVSNYLQLQTMTGRSQIQTQDQLSKGAYDYIQRQMLVSRLTGQNAEMQKSAEQTMTENNVFQVAQRELRQKQQAALANRDPVEAARLEKQFNERIKLIKLLPESMRKGAMDIMLGYISASAEAEQFMRLAPAAARRIQSGQFEATEVLDTVSREAGVNLDRFSGTLGKLGMLTDLFGEYAGIRDLDLMTARDTVTNRAAQAKQQIEDRKQVQDATSDYAAILVEQRRIREAAEDAINLGTNLVTAAMKNLAVVANTVATAGATVAGVPAPGAPAANPSRPAAGSSAAAPGAATPPAAGSGAARPPAAGSTARLLNLIGRVESGGNYNILVGGRTEPNLANMTVAQVLEFQRGMIGRGHESTAVGKYQIIRSTLQGLVNNGAVSLNEKFSPATQDRLAIALLNERGYQRYLQGAMTVHEFADRVAQQWASFPMPDGTSAYAGVGSNKALVDRSTVVSTLQGYRFGGIASSPDSRYVVEFHGTEAVIPLPNGRSIPVDMPDFSADVHAHTNAIAEQNNRLDDLITIMRTRNQISEKILRAYQS